MSGRHRPRRAADQRRRELGQNLLVDQAVLTRAVARVAPAPEDLIVEIGPGRGALTLALARSGARLIAVERDPAMVAALRSRLATEGLADRVRVIRCDVRRFRWPREPYRVVGNIPFGLTTAILEGLLDDPTEGPWRADLLIQAEVARKRVASPPTSLRSAAWAPWWTMTMGEEVSRQAFRPVPAVDAAWLTIRRRDPSVLPEWLAPGFRETLRPVWSAGR